MLKEVTYSRLFVVYMQVHVCKIRKTLLNVVYHEMEQLLCLKINIKAGYHPPERIKRKTGTSRIMIFEEMSLKLIYVATRMGDV